MTMSPVVKLDASSLAAIFMDYFHHAIHDGEAFVLTDQATVGAAGTREIRIATPTGNKHAHFEFLIMATGETTVELFETTTKTHNAGGALTPVNRNRNSSETSILTISHTPGSTGDGSGIYGPVKFGTDTGGAVVHQVGGSLTGRKEFVLAADEEYLLKVTSGTADNEISIIMDWYEHEDSDGQ